MRTTTFFFTAVCVLLAFLVGCAGQSGTLPTGAPSTQGYAPADYDPFAPEVDVPSTKQVLAATTGISVGGFNVVAMNNLNQVDEAVQEALVLDATSDSLVISLKHAVPYVGLYVRYDSNSSHPTGFTTDRPDGIGIALEPEAGMIAIGVSAFADGLLDPRYPVAAISFEAGASTVSRKLSYISQQGSMAVRELVAIDGGEEAATLGWSERNTGDYDLNGEVNIADITPIAINFGVSFDIDSPDYARLEVVDGDENTEINLSDITPIAVNYSSTVNGYNVYRMAIDSLEDDPAPGDAGWELIPNVGDPSEPTAQRIFNNQKVRLTYTYLDSCGDGFFAWYVAPVGPDGSPREEGPASNVSKVRVTGGTAPDAGLSIVLMPPDGPLMNVDNEFYVGIQIADVEGLFSANVRFEYDASLLEFIEAVPAYEGNLNLLDPPLFIAADDIGTALNPYVLLGFNATQIQGTDAQDGTGFLGFFKFKVIDAATNLEAIRFPVASNFIYLWGDQYGVPAATPVLGSPQVINAG